MATPTPWAATSSLSSASSSLLSPSRFCYNTNPWNPLIRSLTGWWSIKDCCCCDPKNLFNWWIVDRWFIPWHDRCCCDPKNPFERTPTGALLIDWAVRCCCCCCCRRRGKPFTPMGALLVDPLFTMVLTDGWTSVGGLWAVPTLGLRYIVYFPQVHFMAILETIDE